MADAIYDAIIVGGGHQGTIIGALLADAGLSVAIFERQREMGGGACGEDLPLPGFIQNTCGHFTRFWAHPTYKKLKLKEHGLHYVFAANEDDSKGMAGIAFDNGKCIVGYPALKVKDPDTGSVELSQKNVDRTIAEVARISQKDAEKVAWLLKKFAESWAQAYDEASFNPPKPWGEPGPLERLTMEKDGIPPEYQFYTVQQMAFDLFESPEMRLYFMKACISTTGCFPGDVPSLYNFIRTLAIVCAVESPSIVYGGTHTITHALQRAFSSKGGEFFVMSEVDKVLIENGRATGVKLADGTEVKARKFVVSDCGAPQTMLRLVGEEKIPEKIASRTKNINYDRAQIFWGNVAMHEKPEYKCWDYNPDFGKQPIFFMCPRDLEHYAFHYQHEIFTKGYAEKNYLLVGPDSLWDPTRAPDGKHTFLMEEFGAPHRFFPEDYWLEMKGKILPKRMLNVWREFAPNMTDENVIHTHLTSPYDVARRNVDMLEGSWSVGAMLAGQMDRMRPFPELSGFRTPVKDLYICSANMHPGGGIGRGSGVCCYKVIAGDHGLKPMEDRQLIE